MAPNSNLLGSLQLPFFRPMGLDFYTVKHNRWFLLITGLVKVLVQHGRRKNVTDNMILNLSTQTAKHCTLRKWAMNSVGPLSPGIFSSESVLFCY